MDDLSGKVVRDEINRRAVDIWEKNAAFWDDRFGEGNQFQNLLIGPATGRLLDIRPGEIVLDAACGNGHYSRRLAEAGAKVIAFDASPTFIERARIRSVGYEDQIEYHIIDATDQDQLMALGENRFDAGVCTMALMDIGDIAPLFKALNHILKPGGRFIFSVTHPCFNTSGTEKVIEESDQEGELVTSHSIKVFRYKSLGVAKGLGIIGQPQPQYYFNRSISEMFSICFKAGFIVDGLEEPTFQSDTATNRSFSWANFLEIPPILVTRIKLT